jgi:hypothetical protein
VFGVFGLVCVFGGLVWCVVELVQQVTIPPVSPTPPHNLCPPTSPPQAVKYLQYLDFLGYAIYLDNCEVTTNLSQLVSMLSTKTEQTQPKEDAFD